MAEDGSHTGSSDNCSFIWFSLRDYCPWFRAAIYRFNSVDLLVFKANLHSVSFDNSFDLSATLCGRGCLLPKIQQQGSLQIRKPSPNLADCRTSWSGQTNFRLGIWQYRASLASNCC